MLNSSGERGEPCGVPCDGVMHVVDNVLSYLNLIFLFARNECIILQKCSEVYGSNVCMMPLCHVLSNACCMSSENARVYLFLLKLFVIVCATCSMFSDVSLLGKKAVW